MMPAADGGQTVSSKQITTLPKQITADRIVSLAGLVEGLTGAYLSGWAIDTDRAAACKIMVVDDDDRIVARGVADRPRSDLPIRGASRTDYAFRLSIGQLGASAFLRVYANGAELPGSPLATGPNLWDGALSVHDGWAEGWVHERRLDFAPPNVMLFDQDDYCLGEAPTVPSSADPLFSPAWFRVPLAQAAWRRPELALRAVVNGITVARAHTAMTLKGYLDKLEPRRCAGWLFSPEAPSVRLTLEVWRNGQAVAQGVASMPREDLRGPFPDGWRSGFEISLPAEPPGTDPPHTISLRLAGSDAELFEGPFLLGSPFGLIAPARRIAAFAHSLELSPGERWVLQTALARFIAHSRTATDQRHCLPPATTVSPRRLTILIPIYRDIDITRACIDSVLAHRNPTADAIVLINDCSPDADMPALLAAYADLPHLHILTNETNRGFVRSINRGLAFIGEGDVLMLNSDTRIFQGGIDELWDIAHAQPDIGTVTALSNNATIFSYPISDQGCERLTDLDWETAAAITLAANQGRAIDVPTGHGFCMLVTRAMLDQVGAFDEAFGRGYGEENDFCQRGADLGFRNVAAAGAFVEHRESVSFAADKQELLRTNLRLLESRYPEYATTIQSFLKRDALRTARWALDTERLRRHAQAGSTFVLMVNNWLDGGTRKATDGILARLRETGAEPLTLCVGEDGIIRLTCQTPRVAAVFAADEHPALLDMLDRVGVNKIQIHQLLGFPAPFIAALGTWCATKDATFMLHDFYPLCPRVTMIDAVGTFCDAAPIETCVRCVKIGGAHDAARMDIPVADHRPLFAGLLRATRCIAPSASAADYVERALPGIDVRVEPHPEPAGAYQVAARAGTLTDIVLLGALGPHKGSAILLDLARRAWLRAPALHFHVIGYTDIDEPLRDIGNVTVTGKYAPDELATRVEETGGKIALFLHRWPETFSYTLSEAVQLGLAPVVPNIGAPAARIRAAGFGHVFPFPIDAATVLDTLIAIADGQTPLAQPGASPASFAM